MQSRQQNSSRKKSMRSHRNSLHDKAVLKAAETGAGDVKIVRYVVKKLWGLSVFREIKGRTCQQVLPLRLPTWKALRFATTAQRITMRCSSSSGDQSPRRPWRWFEGARKTAFRFETTLDGEGSSLGHLAIQLKNTSQPASHVWGTFPAGSFVQKTENARHFVRL